MATVQLRNATEGRAYFDRKTASGKTSMEAMRSLKHRLSDIVTGACSTTPSHIRQRAREDTAERLVLQPHLVITVWSRPGT
jgi:methionine synthase I (cobalamin-dependent)